MPNFDMMVLFSSTVTFMSWSATDPTNTDKLSAPWHHEHELFLGAMPLASWFSVFFGLAFLLLHLTWQPLWSISPLCITPFYY